MREKGMEVVRCLGVVVVCLLVCFPQFLSSTKTQERERLYIGGRLFGTNPPILGFADVISPQPVVPTPSPSPPHSSFLSERATGPAPSSDYLVWQAIGQPAFDIGDFFSGAIMESDHDVYYFSGQFVEGSSHNTSEIWQKLDTYETITSGIIVCNSSMPSPTPLVPSPPTPSPAPSPAPSNIGKCINLEFKNSTLPPHCPSMPSLATHDRLVAITCDGPPSYLGPGILTSYVFNSESLLWDNMAIPCDIYPVNDPYYCNVKKVWKLQVPFQNVSIDPSTDYRLFLFTTHYPLSNTYNLVYYRYHLGVWGWDTLLPSEGYLNLAKDVRCVAQNNLTGELWVGGQFLCQTSVICYFTRIANTESTYSERNTYGLPSSPETMQIFTDPISNDYLVVVTGTFKLNAPDLPDAMPTLAYYSNASSHQKFCFHSDSVPILECLNLTGHPLSIYVVKEDIPISSDMTLNQFYTPVAGGVSYAVVFYRDSLLPNPPFVLVYSSDYNGGMWSNATYPWGVTSDDFCPIFECFIRMLPADNVPGSYGKDAIFMVSSEKKFRQLISRLSPEVLFASYPKREEDKKQIIALEQEETRVESRDWMDLFEDEDKDEDDAHIGYDQVFAPVLLDFGEVYSITSHIDLIAPPPPPPPPSPSPSPFPSPSPSPSPAPPHSSSLSGSFGHPPPSPSPAPLYNDAPPLITGRFRGDSSPYRNIAVFNSSSGSWLGVGSDGGITNGAVLAVVQWGDVIFAGGVFDQNGTRNLVKIQNCSTMNCGKSDWEPVNKDWTFSENSTIFKLAIYENILIFGGDFILQTGQGALGQKVFYNLVFYDLVREKVLSQSGFDQRSGGDITCVHGVTHYCPCIETLRLINTELWIGGTFVTPKVSKYETFTYTSLARFDMEELEWLPILGLERMEKTASFPGTVSAINFFSENSSSIYYVSPNINQLTTVPDINVLVYLGGIFATPAGDYGGSPPFFNVAQSCLSVRNGSFVATGILQSPAAAPPPSPGIHQRSFHSSFLPPGWLGDDLQDCPPGGYQVIGGTNGPVQDIAIFDGFSDNGENEVIFGGSFSKSAGKNEKVSVNCPILRFSPRSGEWLALPNSRQGCYGTVFSLNPHPGLKVSTDKLLNKEWKYVIGGASLLLFFSVLSGCIYLAIKKREVVVVPVGFLGSQDPNNNPINEYGLERDSTPLLPQWRKMAADDDDEEALPYGIPIDSEDSESRTDVVSLHPYRVFIRGIARSEQLAQSKIEKHPRYTIEVKCGVSAWGVERKYSDFVVLHRILCQSYPTVEFPFLPHRTPETKNDFTTMSQTLQAYLRELLHASFVNQLSRVDQSEPAETTQTYLLQDDIRAFLMDGQVKVVGSLAMWEINIRDIEVEKRIGFGSFAEVYKARWRGMEVAVKILLPSVAGDKQLLTEFTTETSLMSKLHHRNVLSFYGAYCKPPNLCIVTEWMSRGSLYDIIHAEKSKYSKFPLGFRLKLTHDISLGVAYLHSLVPPVIHRDLKSLNLLVDSNWLVKVADFGLSKIKDYYEETSSIVGTPAWTAPEVLKGERYNEKADVYSFGIILWETTVGKRPFSGYRLKQVMEAVCDHGERPPISPDTLPELADLMNDCWQDAQAKRPGFPVICQKIAEMMLQLEKERPFEKLVRHTRRRSHDGTKRQSGMKEKEGDGKKKFYFDPENRMVVEKDVEGAGGWWEKLFPKEAGGDEGEERGQELRERDKYDLELRGRGKEKEQEEDINLYEDSSEVEMIENAVQARQHSWRNRDDFFKEHL